MATSIFIFFLSLILAVQGTKCPAKEAPNKNIVCYYEGTTPLPAVNLCNCTHLIFANAAHYDGSNLTFNKDIDLNEQTALDTKNLSLVFTVNIRKDQISLLKSEEKKINLLNGISSFLRTSQFTGVEINFEFSADDGSQKDDFMSFIKDLRNILDHHRVKRDGYSVFEDLKHDYTTGRYSTEKSAKIKFPAKKQKKTRLPRDEKNVDFYDDDDLSVVDEYLEDEPLLKRMKRRKQENEPDSNTYTIFLRVSTVPEIVAKKYNLKALSKYVDYFMLPTHMITDDSEKHVTFHPSRLMGLSDILNTDSILDLLTGLGVPKSKIIISMPANVLQYELKDAEKNTARSPTVGEPKTINQPKMCSLLKNGDWTVERDEDLTAPYAFSKTTWLAFEDEVSVNIKAKYIILRELAGAAVYPIDSDTDSDNCAHQNGGRVSSALQYNFANLARKPRQVVLESLQEQIHDTAFFSQEAGVHLSEYRIVRVVDHEGAVHVIRKNTKTQFECSRQGYFSHPLGCNKFYRCVKFNQYTDDFTVFEYDCPAGLAFDERWEVCVWPGSLPHGAPCTGSSEIAPVPRSHYGCPNVEGYYADPENCRWFFACLDHARDGVTPLTAYEFRCPFGLVFDENTLVCDWPWVVGGCGARGAAGVVVTRTGGISSYEGAASFATIPDYVISGGRIANKQAGVVLNQNVAGLEGPAGISAFISSVTPSSILVDDGGSSHRSNGLQAVHTNPADGYLVEDGGSSHRGSGLQAVHVTTPTSVLVEDGGYGYRSHGLQAVHATPASVIVEDGGSRHRGNGFQAANVNPVSGILVDDGGFGHRSHGLQAVKVNPASVLLENGGSSHGSNIIQTVQVSTPVALAEEHLAVHVTTPKPIVYQQQTLVKPLSVGVHHSEGYSYDRPAISFGLPSGDRSTVITQQVAPISATPSDGFLVENGGSSHQGDVLQAVHVSTPASLLVNNGGYSHGSNIVQTAQVSTPIGFAEHEVHVTTANPVVYQQQTVVKPLSIGVQYREGYSYDKPTIPFELPSKPALHVQVTPVAPVKPIVYKQPAISLKPVFYQKEIVTPRPIIIQQQVYSASPRPVVYQQEIVTPRPVIYQQEISPVVTPKPVIYQQQVYQQNLVVPKPVVYQQQYVTPKPVIYQQQFVTPKPVVYRQEFVTPRPIIYQQEVSPVVTVKPVIHHQQVEIPKPVVYQQEIVTPKPIVYQQQYVTPKPVVYQQQFVTPKPVIYHQEIVTPKPVVYQQEIVTPKPVVYQQQYVTPKPVVYQQQYVTPKPVVYQQQYVTPKPVVYQQQYVTPKPIVYQQQYVTPKPVVYQQQYVTPKPVIYHQEIVTPKPVVYQQEIVTPEPVFYQQEIVTPKPVVYQQQYVTPKPVIYQQEIVTPKPVIYQQEVVTPKPVVYQQQYVTPKPVTYQQQIATPKPVIYQQEVVTPKPVVYQQQYVTPKPVTYQQQIATPKPVIYQQEVVTAKPVVYQQQYVTPKPVIYQQEIVTPKPVIYQQEVVTAKPVVYQQQYVTPKPVIYQQEIVTPKPVVYQQQYVTPKPVIYQQEIVTSKPVVYQQQFVTPKPVIYRQELVTPKPVIYQQEIVAPKPVVYQQQFVTPKPVVYQQEIVTPKPVVYQQQYVTPKPVVYQEEVVTPKPVVYQQKIVTPKPVIYQQQFVTPKPVVYQQEIVTAKPVIYQQQYESKRLQPVSYARPTFIETYQTTTPKTVIYQENYDIPYQQDIIKIKPTVYQTTPKPTFIETVTNQAFVQVPITTIQPIKYTVRQKFRTTTESREYLPPVEIPVVYQQKIVTPKPVVYQQEFIQPVAVSKPKTLIYQQNYDIPVQQDIVKIKPVVYQRTKIIQATPKPTFIETVEKQFFQPIVVPQILTTPKTVYAESYERINPGVAVFEKDVHYSGEEYLPPVTSTTTAKYVTSYEIPPPPPEYILEVPSTTIAPTKYTVRQKFRTTTESREYLPPVEPKRRNKSRGKTTVVSIGQVDKSEVDDGNLEGVLDKYSGKYGEISDDDRGKFVTKIIQGNQRGTIKIGKEPEVSTVGYEITSSRGRSRGGSRKYSSTSTSTTEAYEETSPGSDISDTGDISLATLDLKNLKIKKNKKTVIVVSQVSDANPILIGKLAGQCSCQSNKLDLKKNDDDGAYDGNYDVEPSTTAAPRARAGKSRGRRPGNDQPDGENYGDGPVGGSRRGGSRNRRPDDRNNENEPENDYSRRGGSRDREPDNENDDDVPRSKSGRRGGSRNRKPDDRDNEDGPLNGVGQRGRSRSQQPDQESYENGPKSDSDGYGNGPNAEQTFIEIGGRPYRGQKLYEDATPENVDYPGEINIEILNNPTSTTTLIPEVSPSILLPLARKPITDEPSLPERPTGRRIPSRSKVRVPFTEKTSPLFSPISADEIASTSSTNDIAEPSKTRAGAAFDRYGPGGWRGADETLQGSVDCKRPGLFRHPKYCNKFYSCNYDPWKKRYTLSVFNCPVHLAYDSNIGACNWPSKGPACADDNLLV